MNELEEYRLIDNLFKQGKPLIDVAKELNIPLSRIRYVRGIHHRQHLERLEARLKENEEFEKNVIELVPKSRSINHICSQLRLRGVREYYTKVLNVIKKYNLDTSHFYYDSGPAEKRYDDADVFAVNDVGRGVVYNHLMKLKNGEELKCEICGITEWNGRPIKLQMHHIDGNCRNNCLSNLQLLCPNCHAQTDNYSGRNKFYKSASKLASDRVNARSLSDDELLSIIERCGTYTKASEELNVSVEVLRRMLNSRHIYDVSRTLTKRYKNNH